MTQYTYQNPPPSRPRQSSAKWIGLGLGLLVLVGVVVTVMLLMRPEEEAIEPAASQPAAAPQQAAVVLEGPAIEIGGKELRDYFHEKPDEAASQYSGKVMDVTGVVSGTTENITGEKAIALEGGVEGFAGVRCVMPTANLFQWHEVKVGETVTIRGRCDGKVTDVVLHDCAVIQKRQ